MKDDLFVYFNITSPVIQNTGSVTLKYKGESINIPFSDIIHMQIDYAAKALNQFKFYWHNLNDVFEQQIIHDFKSYLTIYDPNLDSVKQISNKQEVNEHVAKVFTFDCDSDGVYFDIFIENLDDLFYYFKPIVSEQQNLNNYEQQIPNPTSMIPKYIDKNLICVFIDKEMYFNPNENVYEYINFSYMKSFNIKNHITTHYHLDFFKYSEHCYEDIEYNSTIQNENLDLVTFIMDDGSEIPVSSIRNIYQSMFQVLFNTKQSGTSSCYVMMFYNKLTELLKL